MATEYAIDYLRSSTDFHGKTTTPIGTFKSVDGEVTITGPAEFIEVWKGYFQSQSWLAHVAKGSALASLFESSTYSTAEVLTGNDAEARYLKAVNEVNGESETVRAGIRE